MQLHEEYTPRYRHHRPGRRVVVINSTLITTAPQHCIGQYSWTPFMVRESIIQLHTLPYHAHTMRVAHYLQQNSFAYTNPQPQPTCREQNTYWTACYYAPVPKAKATGYRLCTRVRGTRTSLSSSNLMFNGHHNQGTHTIDRRHRPQTYTSQ